MGDPIRVGPKTGLKALNGKSLGPKYFWGGKINFSRCRKCFIFFRVINIVNNRGALVEKLGYDDAGQWSCDQGNKILWE